MQQAMVYVLPVLGLIAGAYGWFSRASGSTALSLLGLEAFGLAILLFGG